MEEKTCGQGLAENSELPAKVGELMAAISAVLETHREALAPRDANSRREDEAYRELAQALRKGGEDLRTAATRMAGYRDLAMGKHDTAVLSAPKALQALEKFVRTEGEIVALLQRRLVNDRWMLDQMRGSR
jgi:hypothetical protein